MMLINHVHLHFHDFAHSPIEIGLHLLEINVFRMLVAKIVVMTPFRILVVHKEQAIVDAIATALEFLHKGHIACRWKPMGRHCFLHEGDSIEPPFKRFMLCQFAHGPLAIVAQVISIRHITMVIVLHVLRCAISKQRPREWSRPRYIDDMVIRRRLNARW